MTDKVILDMQHISKRFLGVVALDGASLSVRRGEIHSVIGENGAGKSTLMKCLLGLHTPDEGTITFDGEKVSFKSPRDALLSGISMIHQEMSLVPTMTVSENIWLGQEEKFSSLGFISVAQRTQATRDLLSRWNLRLDPLAMVNSLSIAGMQLVELARALSYNTKVLIMDEPTSALTKTEIEQLFKIIRSLAREHKVSVIFISHKLDEIYEICDRVSVYRDGHYIETSDIGAISMSQLMNMIAGRQLSEMFPKMPARIGDVVLEVKNFTSEGIFSDINFQLRRGEILGFCGLMGAGRTEIMRALFGIDRYTSGTVEINGKPVKIKNPSSAVAHGLGMVTEDRLRMGSIHSISILANTTLAYFKNICNKLGFYRSGKELKDFNTISGQLSVKYSSPGDLMSQLSGGNQQKVIIARWLLTQPEILILDEPTRGIDVGAKADIHSLISKLAVEGKAILMVSSELPEIMGMSDRIIVIREGRQVYECLRKDATPELLMSWAFGSNKQA